MFYLNPYFTTTLTNLKQVKGNDYSLWGLVFRGQTFFLMNLKQNILFNKNMTSFRTKIFYITTFVRFEFNYFNSR